MSFVDGYAFGLGFTFAIITVFWLFMVLFAIGESNRKKAKAKEKSGLQ